MVHFAIPNKLDDEGRLDRISLALSAVLFVSPWALGYADNALAARTAWISAIVIALVSALATQHFSEWEEWVNLLAGAWLVAAPWLLKFQIAGDAVGVFTGVGAIIVTIAMAELWDERHPGQKPLPGP
ncbi:SPW repeat protein [Rhodoblastus sp.]|uniref:SPW repeat protein n=1 Tax=Rhodoblastus sp. TaxID=1962975 RepID=UPI003F97E299